jgi:hypothetical protein
MAQQFEAILSGSDAPVDGLANETNYPGYANAWEFRSIDGTLHLVIAKDDEGDWVRVDGTEPYFSAWVGELAEQVSKNQ